MRPVSPRAARSARRGNPRPTKGVTGVREGRKLGAPTPHVMRDFSPPLVSGPCLVSKNKGGNDHDHPDPPAARAASWPGDA